MTSMSNSNYNFTEFDLKRIMRIHNSDKSAVENIAFERFMVMKYKEGCLYQNIIPHLPVYLNLLSMCLNEDSDKSILSKVVQLLLERYSTDILELKQERVNEIQTMLLSETENGYTKYCLLETYCKIADHMYEKFYRNKALSSYNKKEEFGYSCNKLETTHIVSWYLTKKHSDISPIESIAIIDYFKIEYDVGKLPKNIITHIPFYVDVLVMINKKKSSEELFKHIVRDMISTYCMKDDYTGIDEAKKERVITLVSELPLKDSSIDSILSLYFNVTDSLVKDYYM